MMVGWQCFERALSYCLFISYFNYDVEEKVYTWEEVGKHNTDTDMWIVVDEKVYDVTAYSN